MTPALRDDLIGLAAVVAEIAAIVIFGPPAREHPPWPGEWPESTMKEQINCNDELPEVFDDMTD